MKKKVSWWERDKGVIFLIVLLFGGIVGLITLWYSYGFRPYRVTGAAMEPTYKDGAYLLATRVSSPQTTLKRGDVVVFHYTLPEGEGMAEKRTVDFIKRVIGFAGEKIEIREGKVLVNSDQLEEVYLAPGVVTVLWDDAFLQEGEEVVVPEGQYFMLGDNRGHSSDSRAYGFVLGGDIVSRVMFCYADCGR